MTPYPIEMPVNLLCELEANGKPVGEMYLEDAVLGIDDDGRLQCVAVERALIEPGDKCPVSGAIWKAATEKFKEPNVQKELDDLMFWNKEAQREAAFDQHREWLASAGE